MLTSGIYLPSSQIPGFDSDSPQEYLSLRFFMGCPIFPSLKDGCARRIWFSGLRIWLQLGYNLSDTTAEWLRSGESPATLEIRSAAEELVRRGHVLSLFFGATDLRSFLAAPSNYT